MPTMTPALATANIGSAAAACAEVDPELMFPFAESHRPGQRTPGELDALAVCARCQIAASCHEDVLKAEMPYGVAGAMTVADRRAERARRRGLDTGATPAPAAPAPAPAHTSGVEEDRSDSECAAPRPAGRRSGAVGVDAAVAAVLAEQARFAHAADPAQVTALLSSRATCASRWEVALAAAAAIQLGHSTSAAARLLGEQYSQVKRWRDRAESREALVRGPVRTGTSPLPRPATGTTAPTTAAVAPPQARRAA